MQPNRPNRKERRRMGMRKTQMTMQPRRVPPPKPPKPQTKETIMNQIRMLEYERIQIPRYTNSRFVARRLAMGDAIQVLRKKLELLKKAEEKKDESNS